MNINIKGNKDFLSEKFDDNESELEDFNSIYKKIQTQTGLMSEYKQWLQVLLNVLNNNNDFEYYKLIKNVSLNVNFYKDINKIEDINKNHIFVKKIYLQDKLKLDSLTNKIENIKNEINLIKENNMNSEYVKMIIKKTDLIENIESISKDIDFYSEKTDEFKKISNIKNKKECIKLIEERISFLKEENSNLKSKITKNSIENKINPLYNTKKNINIFSCFTNANDRESTLFLNK